MSLPKADIDRMGRASRKLYNKGIGTLSRRYDYALKLLAKINTDVKSSEQKILTTKYVNKKILKLDIAGLYKLYNERNYAIWLAIRYVIVCQTYPKATFKGDTDMTTEEQWNKMFPQFKGIFDYDSIVQEWISFTGIEGGGLESVAAEAIELVASAIAGTVALGTAIDEASREPEGGSGGAAVPPLRAPASIYTSNVPPIEELENRHRRLREIINVSRMDSIFAGEYEVEQTNSAFMTEEEIMRQRESIERDSLQILQELMRLYDEREEAGDEQRRNVREVQIQMELHKLRQLLSTYSTPELIETLSVFRRFSADKEKIGYREMQEMQDEINKILRQRVRDVNIPEGSQVKKKPSSTNLRDILLKLLTLPNSIIQIPQSIFNVAFRDNIYMWSEIGALLNEVLGNDDFVNYLLRMPSRKKDATARARMVNEIVEKLMSAKGEKLDLLRTLNDILLYHLTKENISSFKDSDKAKIAKALGIRPQDLTQEKYLKYITDRMIQDPKKDSATSQPKGNIGLYDEDVIDPLIARVYERFYATGVLSVEQAQEFTMYLINSVNRTTDFSNLRQLLSEEEVREMTSGQLSPEYTLAKDEAIGRVVDTLNEILNEFNESLKKVIIDPKKIYELVKEAMAQFKAQVGGSLIDKLKRLKDVFKGIEDKQLKKYPTRPVPTPEPEPVPTPEPEPEPRYPEDPSEIEMQEVQESIRLEQRPDSLTSRGLRRPLPIRQDPRLRATLADIHRQIYNNPLGVDSRAISNTLIELARSQAVVQGAGFTVNSREWAEGDEPPEDPSTPLEIIDNRTGRRWRTTVGRIVALAVFLSGVGVGIWEIFQIIKDGVDDIPPIPPIKPDPPIPPKPPVPPIPPIPPEPPVPPEPVPPVNPTPSDDPSSWINKPPDEGDILITAINPAESYLFNSTQKQKEDEYERFREFSMVPPADLENPLVFDAYMSQNRRFRNTYPNPKVPPMKYVDIKRNRQPQFQDVRFDVLNRKKDMFQRQDSFYTDCGFTREIQQDPFVQDYRRSNYFPDRAVLGQPQDAYRGDKSLQWINNDGADRFSRKDRWYEGSYDGQREVDKTLYKSKRYDFTIDRFYSRKQR